jgi:hypothetical protein
LKLLQESIEKTLEDTSVEVEDNFLNRTLIAQEIKERIDK